MSARLATLVALSLLSLLVAAGCGEVTVEGNVNTGDEISGSDVEDAIVPELKRQFAEREVDHGRLAIDCPAGIKQKSGTEFTCTVTDDDEAIGEVDGTTTGTGKFDWDFYQHANAEALEQQIRDTARERSIDATDVSCADDLVLRPNDTFTCKVDDRYLEMTVDPEDTTTVTFGNLREDPID